MGTVVTTKGQVTIPKRLRDHLGISAGTEVEFRVNAGGEVVIERADRCPPPSRFARFQGIADGGLSTDEIMRLFRGDPDE